MYVTNDLIPTPVYGPSPAPLFEEDFPLAGDIKTALRNSNIQPARVLELMESLLTLYKERLGYSENEEPHNQIAREVKPLIDAYRSGIKDIWDTVFLLHKIKERADGAIAEAFGF